MEPLQRKRRLTSKKLINLGCDEITHMTKGRQPLLFAPSDPAGIRESPMDLLPCIRKEGTGFSRLITDGNHQIHRGQSRKFLNTFSSMPCQINLDLVHGLDR